MGLWEYKVLTLDPDDSSYEYKLNCLGHEGWELVGFPYETKVVFKRRTDGFKIPTEGEQP